MSTISLQFLYLSRIKSVALTKNYEYTENWRLSNTNTNKSEPQALVSFKKYVPPPLPYFKVNICPFPLTPLRFNIFRLFVILSLTQLQLYRYSPKIFLFSTATFEYTYRAPLRRIGQEYSANVALYKVHVYVFWTFC